MTGEVFKPCGSGTRWGSTCNRSLLCDYCEQRLAQAQQLTRLGFELDAAKRSTAALREELAASRKNTELAQESMQLFAIEADGLQQRLADAERRYRGLQKLTPYKFRKIQDASTTDGIDVLYFHADRFDALLDAALTKPEEAKS